MCIDSCLYASYAEPEDPVRLTASRKTKQKIAQLEGGG